MYLDITKWLYWSVASEPVEKWGGSTASASPPLPRSGPPQPS